MKEKQRQYVIMGLAMGLPSTILAVAVMAYKLVEGGYISQWMGLVLVLVVIIYMFFLMIRYAVYKKNKRK